MEMAELQQVRDAVSLVEAAEGALAQVKARLSELVGNRGGDVPVLSRRELARVEKLGPVAHRHLEFLEAHGGEMTLGESLAIRREMYGTKVQSTANLFGRKGEGAILHRRTPSDQPRRDDDLVTLTEEGERVARLWRQLHRDAV